MKINHFTLIIMGIILLAMNGCHSVSPLEEGTGYLETAHGKVWYRIVGKGTQIPLLVLHGGPGVSSDYLRPMDALGKDRKVIYYDQLGSGRSDTIKDTALMTVDFYVEELHQVVQKLGLKEFYLYGQSWGSALAISYYLKHPEGIKALIFSSPVLSTKLWIRDSEKLIATLPDSLQQAIHINEQRQTYDHPDYLNAVNYYYQRYVVRKTPWSEDLQTSFSAVGPAYAYMWGPSEFTATGELKTFDCTSRLHKVVVPTLFLTGEFDEALPTTVQYYQSLVPRAKFALIHGAAHVTMHDNPEEHNRCIEEFLDTIERK